EVELGVEVLELGLVELAAAGDVANVAAAVGGPDPQVILPDGAADVGAILVHLVDPVAGKARPHFRRLRLPGAVGAQVARLPTPVVGAALGHLVDGDARGRDVDVGRSDRQLHLFEGPEVEVSGRAAHRVHVGQDDAVAGE